MSNFFSELQKAKEQQTQDLSKMKQPPVPAPVETGGRKDGETENRKVILAKTQMTREPVIQKVGQTEFSLSGQVSAVRKAVREAGKERAEINLSATESQAGKTGERD